MNRIKRREDGVVVEMHDRPCQSAEDYDVVKELLTAAGRQHPRLVVDCSKVESIGGQFLSALLSAFKTLSARPGDIVLCELKPIPREIIEVTKLDRLFPIHATVDEALRATEPEPTPIVVDGGKR